MSTRKKVGESQQPRLPKTGSQNMISRGTLTTSKAGRVPQGAEYVRMPLGEVGGRAVKSARETN
jgi:hypothetical protein